MAKRKLNWHIWSSIDRNQAIDLLKQILSEGGGSIVQFQRFSDLGLGMTVEVEECDIYNIYNGLKDAFSLDGEAPGHLDQDSDEEWLLLLHLSFGSGTGDFKLEVPAVPS